MTIDDKIRDEKLQYDVNWEAAKISALSSGKNFNMNILQVKKILSDQRRVAEQAKFIYSYLGKALEKKQKLLNIKEKIKSRHLKSMENN